MRWSAAYSRNAARSCEPIVDEILLDHVAYFAGRHERRRVEGAGRALTFEHRERAGRERVFAGRGQPHRAGPVRTR